jgi:hypothetical protein
MITFGIERGTAIRIMDGEVSAAGLEAVMVIDGRYATTLAAGDNNVIAANWLLLDTFAAGETIEAAACASSPASPAVYLPAVHASVK